LQICERFRREFVDVLRQLREQLGFLLMGWVLMPEHFHLLLPPQPAESTSRILPELKKQTALRLISTLGANRQYPWCGKVLTRLRLPPGVQSDSHYRVGQRRLYPFNVHSRPRKNASLLSS
jgi:REP element-mobilizing transposase RayT